MKLSPRLMILKRFAGKKPSEAGRSVCSFNFFIRKFWFLNEILTEKMSASLRKN